MSGSGVGVLADDKYPDLIEGLGECPQHVLPGWQIAVTGRYLRTEKVTDRGDVFGEWGKYLSPAGIEEFDKRLTRHADGP
jgi:hypothetical protein